MKSYESYKRSIKKYVKVTKLQKNYDLRVITRKGGGGRRPPPPFLVTSPLLLVFLQLGYFNVFLYTSFIAFIAFHVSLYLLSQLFHHLFIFSVICNSSSFSTFFPKATSTFAPSTFSSSKSILSPSRAVSTLHKTGVDPKHKRIQKNKIEKNCKK